MTRPITSVKSNKGLARATVRFIEAVRVANERVKAPPTSESMIPSVGLGWTTEANLAIM